MGTTPVKSSAVDEAEDPEIEAKRARAAQMAWGQDSSQQQPAQSAVGSKDAGGSGGEDLDDVSLEELQAELERRRASRKEA